MTELHPVAAAALAASQGKTSLDQMIDRARSEAARIEGVQRGLIDLGIRKAPDAGQIEAMHEWDSIATTLELVKKHEHAFRNLVKKPERRI